MKLIVKNLNKSYGEKTVLDNVSYCFNEGTIYSILGRNGAGKTTFFNCLSNQTTFESGTIFLLDRGAERPLNSSDIGLVLATPQLPDYLTGYEFVYFFSQLQHNKLDPTKINDFFDLVQIEPADRHRLIKEYSYGMKNKLQLLSCLVRNPTIILLDEPLSSFDIIVSHEIKQLLLKMKKDHIILMCTHIMQLAQDISDEILLLHKHQIMKTSFTDYHSKEFEQAVINALDKNDNE